MLAPGDEVVLVRAIDYSDRVAASVTVGSTYTVRAVVPRIMMDGSADRRHVLIELVEADWGGHLAGVRGAYRPQYFRKVHKRDLTSWLSDEQTFEEPRRAPAKKREHV